jgi:hypothetical protein
MSSHDPAPDQALILDLVADVAVLRAAMTALIQGAPSDTQAHLRQALATLAAQSREAAQVSPATALMDAVVQRRLAAFEAALLTTLQRM